MSTSKKVFNSYEEFMLYLLKNYDVSLVKRVKEWLMRYPIHTLAFTVEDVEGNVVVERITYIWSDDKAVEYIDRKTFIVKPMVRGHTYV